MKLTKNQILKSLPTQTIYAVQMTGGKFHHVTRSKREAARIAWAHATDGWRVTVKGGEGQTIWESTTELNP